jgi:hypothetical protein
MHDKIGMPPNFYTGSADRLLYKGRCLLVYARLVAIGADGTLDIYDGPDTTGVLKLPLQTVQKYADESCPPVGMIFEQGVYVDIAGGTSKYVIGICPIMAQGGEG